MQMDWLTEAVQFEEAAAFFASNVDSDPAYISHSELMWGRALTPDTWSPDLHDIIKREFSALADEITVGHKRVARCLIDGSLAAIALVAFEVEASIPFAVLEDIVVAADQRRNGIGQAFLTWILDRVREQKIGRVILESGLGNDVAHHWFEKNGFRQVSIVMMASI